MVFSFYIKIARLFFCCLYLALIFHRTSLSFFVQIIHFARNSRMICWREDFDARVCGVLRKLVNVTGRNPNVIYPLRRGSPGGLIKKKSRIRIDSVERRSARSRLGIQSGLFRRRKKEGSGKGQDWGERDEARNPPPGYGSAAVEH